ncbi:MAG: hypothetical protein CMJ84_02235 [Planctomycetes bacterium]|nr:hypothetical protein [Planctomycetota bacterium]
MAAHRAGDGAGETRYIGGAVHRADGRKPLFAFTALLAVACSGAGGGVWGAITQSAGWPEQH